MSIHRSDSFRSRHEEDFISETSQRFVGQSEVVDEASEVVGEFLQYSIFNINAPEVSLVTFRSTRLGWRRCVRLEFA